MAGKIIRRLSIFVIILAIVLGISNVYENNINIKVGEKATITTFNVMSYKYKNEHIDITDTGDIEIVGVNSGNETIELYLLGVPIKKVNVTVSEYDELIPVGTTIGIRINTQGVLVLGTGEISNERGQIVNPSENKVYTGDIIFKVDDVDINKKEQLIKYIENTNKNTVKLHITRKGEVVTPEIDVVKSIVDNKNKIGLWVRDSTQGIGTMTFVDPDTKEFGSLGHGIIDIDTKDLMKVKDGQAYLARVKNILKGAKGAPGQLKGEITVNNYIGEIYKNSHNGIFGVVDDIEDLGDLSEPMKVAEPEEIKEGYAQIMCNLVGDQVEKYDIEIENINFDDKNNKNFVVKITDEKLLDTTSGIVQGMSGSPIIQDNKIIGAVTHVFLNDPTRGFGIYIKEMK